MTRFAKTLATSTCIPGKDTVLKFLHVIKQCQVVYTDGTYINSIASIPFSCVYVNILGDSEHTYVCSYICIIAIAID